MRHIKTGFNGKPIGKWHEVEDGANKTRCGIPTAAEVQERHERWAAPEEAICEKCRKARPQAPRERIRRK